MNKMKKVFLVDDEMIIRQGIRNSIDWEKEGYEYCGDAPDGEMALPLIEQCQPDIVITDIEMPFMDGLQLSKIIREKMSRIKIVILSGHDEFEYAREALRIQISEYCLKPVSSSDLLEILQKVSSKIDQEELEKEKISNLKHQLFCNESLAQEKFLKELCEGIYSTTDAIKIASELNVDLISSYFLVLIAESKKIEVNLDWISKNYPSLTYQRNANERVYIIKGKSKSQIEQDAENIRKQFLLNRDAITFGFGKIESRIQEIMNSYDIAKEEKSYSDSLNKYFISGEEINNQSFGEIHQFNRKELINFLKFGNKTEVFSFVQTYSSYLRSTKFRTPFITHYFLMDFTVTVSHYIKEQEESASVLNDIYQLENKVNWIREYSEIIDYMVETLNLSIDYREQISNSSSLIRKAKDYMDSNYSNSNLSLQTIANKIHISPSYLSHLFSQQTGKTLVEYLTEIRINRAKELLNTTNYKTYEIANKVGYNDSHYFCNLFKKITGKTTTEFKNSSNLQIS